MTNTWNFRLTDGELFIFLHGGQNKNAGFNMFSSLTACIVLNTFLINSLRMDSFHGFSKQWIISHWNKFKLKKNINFACAWLKWIKDIRAYKTHFQNFCNFDTDFDLVFRWFYTPLKEMIIEGKHCYFVTLHVYWDCVEQGQGITWMKEPVLFLNRHNLTCSCETGYRNKRLSPITPLGLRGHVTGRDVFLLWDKAYFAFLFSLWLQHDYWCFLNDL